MIQRIEIDVTQQRAEHGTLRCSRSGSPLLHPFHDVRLQERFDQLQECSIRNLFPQPVNQARMRVQTRVVKPI